MRSAAKSLRLLQSAFSVASAEVSGISVESCARHQPVTQHIANQPLATVRRAAALPAVSYEKCFSATARHFATTTRHSAGTTKEWHKKSSRSTAAREYGLYLVSIVVGMVGITYASVPLYRMFCQATGFGGTVQIGKTVEDKIRERAANPKPDVESAAAARDITVTFAADVAPNMPWSFVPCQRSVTVKPGQSTLVFYTASNKSNKAVTGVSTYNVTPNQVGYYFNKIQCFCFEEQRLRPGETIDMPVFFYIDPEFSTDPKLRKINNIVLSYTFFKVDEDDDEPTNVAATASPA